MQRLSTGDFQGLAKHASSIVVHAMLLRNWKDGLPYASDVTGGIIDRKQLQDARFHPTKLLSNGPQRLRGDGKPLLKIGDERTFSVLLQIPRKVDVDEAAVRKMTIPANELRAVQLSSNHWIKRLMKPPADVANGTTASVTALIQGTFTDHIPASELWISDK